MIGVVTVTFNSADVLPGFLRCMGEQTADHRLYVVDNASSDSTLELLDTILPESTIVLRQAENLGIAVGNNIGALAALADGCDTVLFLNNDTEFEPDLLARLEATRSATGAGAVVPSIRFFDEPDRVWFESARLVPWRGRVPVEVPPVAEPRVVQVECVCTCCVLVGREVFERIGLMDQRYFVYFDDTDFFVRAGDAGIVLMLDPSITMLHKVSVLTGGDDSPFTQRQMIMNRVYFVSRHNGGVRRLLGFAFIAVTALRRIGRAPRGERRATGTRMLGAFRDGRRLVRSGPDIPSVSGGGRDSRP